jgi:hypothetical protein
MPNANTAASTTDTPVHAQRDFRGCFSSVDDVMAHSVWRPDILVEEKPPGKPLRK